MMTPRMFESFDSRSKQIVESVILVQAASITFTGLFGFYQRKRMLISMRHITKRTKITDVIEYKMKEKFKWAGHLAK